MTKDILFCSGSSRENSYSMKFLNYAFSIAEKIGIKGKIIDISKYVFPLYSQDIQQKNGIPENVTELRKIFHESRGVFFVTPEHNGSFSSALKNTIDWISRTSPDESKKLIPFGDKGAAISSISVGQMGGIRANFDLRTLCLNLKMNVVGSTVAIPDIANAFDSDESLINLMQFDLLNNILRSLDKISV